MKNDIIKLNIIDMNKDGYGVAKENVNGINIVYFVKDGIIGDEVNAVVTKEAKNIVYAKVVDIIKPSNFRVKTFCEVPTACGGCQLLLLDYKKQIELKSNIVKNNLIRIGNFDKDFIEEKFEGVICSIDPCHFRNKMIVPIAEKNGKVITGFYAGRTHHIVENSFCMTGFKGAEEILNVIKKYLQNKIAENKELIYDENTKRGLFRQIYMRCSNNGSNKYFLDDSYNDKTANYKEYKKQFAKKCEQQVNVTFVVNDNDYKKNINLYDELSNELQKNFQKGSHKIFYISGISLNINTKDTNVILGDKCVNLFGNDYVEDELMGLKFHISEQSFYQVNMEMTTKLYSLILEFLNINSDDEILDLYCGIGTITLMMAKFANRVLGIEIVKEAIENAKENAKLNNINNAGFKCLDANAIDDNQKFDIITIDPPRKGLDEKTINAIKIIAPKKLLYVSCDSSTLSRDLKMLCENNQYEIVRIKSVDMFPHTMHIETCCLLNKL